MPRLTIHCAWGIIFLSIMAFCPSILAANDQGGHYTQSITPNGRMNWTTGIATATGLGVPPRNAVSAMQSREMTRAAAWSVALRNLLEVVKGIQVDARTTVHNYVTTDAKVQTRVEGLIQGAELIQERELPSGEFETTVQLKVAGPMTESLTKVTPEPQTTTKLKTKVPPTPAIAQAEGKKSETEPKLASKTPYTGLVIDARRTGARPALAPRIMTQDVEIYGPARVDQKFIVGPSVKEPGRIAWYMTDDATARSHHKVSDNPLIIKAVRTAGENNTDLVIEDTKAEYIEALPEHRAFLTQAKVVIIVDPK